MSYLDEAIALERDALERVSEAGPEDRAASLGKLSGFLYSRYQECGRLPDLEEALVLQREILDILPETHPDRLVSHGILSQYLYVRFKQLGMLSDIEEALALERNASRLYSPDDHNRAASLGNVASFLQIRYQVLGKEDDLNEALSLQQEVLDLRPPGHPGHAISLGNLADCLHSRYDAFGAMPDLDEAIKLERKTLALRPQGHPDRAAALGNLANSLHDRFEASGTLSNLQEALVLQGDALGLYPEGHPQRATSMDRLAGFIYTRFEQFGTPSDLQEAIAIQRNALELLPEGHRSRVNLLSHLASFLHADFKLSGDPSDLEEAVEVQRVALKLHPEGDPSRVMSLGNIALFLRTRFEYLGSVSDVDEAIAFAREALECHPDGHPIRAISLANLGTYLHSRFKKVKTKSDLDEAICLERSALELRPQGRPYRANSLGNLAHYLHTRFKHSNPGDVSDLQETFDLYSQLSDVVLTVSPHDLERCRIWIQTAEEHEHSTTILAYQTFFRLSFRHLAILPCLPRHLTLVKELMTSTAADAFSACIRHGNYANAVEFLEQGRGVLWNQLSRLQTPLDEVAASGETGKKLAQTFTQLASLLRSAIHSSPDAESQNNWAFRFNIRLQDTITDIRELPGLSNFLLPPSFSDLRLAAACGPVIIVNASKYSCDALVVLSDKDPVHIALPITTSQILALSWGMRFLVSRARFRNVTKKLLIILRELWDLVVFPIVKVLQEFHPPQSRIWWCPTAEFSLLPLHAAGSFREGEPILSDIYVSSYTPTLSALIRARQKRPSDPSIEQCRFLVVGQARAAEESKLDSVNTELSSVSRHVGSVAKLVCIQDTDATIANVTEELGKNTFVHLACRGVIDEEQPFESGFALCDGLLKVEDIIRYDLQDAQFAYLSTSDTTVGDEEGSDQLIHLAAALQFSGFRSIIGTMWGVDDRFADEIASKFYEFMLEEESGGLDHTRAALALHKTMTSLRSSNMPLDQGILYVHVGA